MVQELKSRLVGKTVQEKEAGLVGKTCTQDEESGVQEEEACGLSGVKIEG